MAELTDREKQQIEETHDTVIKIKTVLLGANGNEGLCGEVKSLSERHNRLAKTFWITFGGLIGSGLIALGIERFIV